MATPSLLSSPFGVPPSRPPARLLTGPEPPPADAALAPEVPAPDRLGEAQILDPEMRQQLPRDAARRHAGRGFTRGGALEHVPDVGVPVLQRTGEVRMAWSQARDRLGLVALLRRGHLRRPVRVVLVFEDKGDRASDRHAAAHAAHDARDVGLDFLAPPASMAALTPREIAPQVLFGDLESPGNSVTHPSHPRPLRSTRGQPSQHSG